jgi:hypothetical protein
MTLLKRKEYLSVNLSSSQLTSVLDLYIYSAVTPIFQRCQSFALQWVCDLLCVVNTTPHKRKFSVNLTNEDLTLALGRILTCAPEEQMAALKYAALDRIYLITFISTFSRLAKRALPEADPETLSNARNSERQAILKTLGLQSWMVEPLLNKVALYDRLSDLFVSYISEKYVKLAQLRTKAMINGSGLKLSEKDLNANNNMMIVRAIYKYSAEKGTLTDFIQMWMRSNNNPRFAHEFGLAYSLPQSKRKALSKQGWVETGGAVMNLAVDLEDAENVASDISGNMLDQSEDTSNLQFLYKAAAMLRDDAQVRFYMKAFGFPDLSDALRQSFIYESQDWTNRVKQWSELKELEAPPPAKTAWRKTSIKRKRRWTATTTSSRFASKTRRTCLPKSNGVGC